MTDQSRRQMLKLGGGAVALGGTIAVTGAATERTNAANVDPLMTLWIERQAIDKRAMALYNRAEAIAGNYPCKLAVQPVMFEGRQFLAKRVSCICEDQVIKATKYAKSNCMFRGKTREEVDAYGQIKLAEIRRERKRVDDLRRKSGYTALIQEAEALTDRVIDLDYQIAEMQASTLIGLCVQAVLWGFCCTDEDSMEDKIGHTMAVAAKRMLMQAGAGMELLAAARRPTP